MTGKEYHKFNLLLIRFRNSAAKARESARLEKGKPNEDYHTARGQAFEAAGRELEDLLVQINK